MIDNIQMQVYINLYYKDEINDTLITIAPIHFHTAICYIFVLN